MTFQLTAIVTLEFGEEDLIAYYGPAPVVNDRKKLTKYINQVLADSSIELEMYHMGRIAEHSTIKVLTYNFLDINCKDGGPNNHEVRLY